MKRIIALLLCLLMVVGMFSACGGETEPAETTEATQPGEEGKILKVLTLGHSLAVDAGFMLAKIAATEGYESMKVGTLYYSGCPMNKHVEFATADAPEYDLRISSTENANQPPDVMEPITMKQALQFEYWDIIVMQDGVFDIASDASYKAGNIQTLQNYVKENVKNPNIKFAWHMTWVPPVDSDLRNSSPVVTYYNNGYKTFNNDRATIYQAVTKCVSDNILTDSTFQYVIPSATVMENMLSSYLEEKDIHRDYVHASDLARVAVSYVWYCKLAGIEKLDALQYTSIPKQFLNSTLIKTQDVALSESEQAVILEAVNNALANPLQMTQSQYTTAP